MAKSRKLACQCGKRPVSLSSLERGALMMTATADEARRALEAKGAAERDLARLAVCPPWRHAAFAAVMSALVATPALAIELRFGVLALVFVAIALIVQSDRRRLGVFVNGYRRGRTRWVTFPMLAIFMILYGASIYAGQELHHPVISLIGAVVAFGVGYLGSVLWQKVFVDELGA
jgi:hypothetical protein